MPNDGRVPYDEIVRRARLEQAQRFEEIQRQQWRNFHRDALLYGQAVFPNQPAQQAQAQPQQFLAGPENINDLLRPVYEAVPVAPIPQQEVAPPEDKEMKLINPFLIGCDPEFVAFDANGAHMSVENLVPQKGEVGYDHGGFVLEARPRPAKSSFTLLKSLWGGMKSLKIPASKYRAGAYLEFPNNKKITLGGHVHIDLPFNQSVENRYRVLALDEITTLFEQLDILPTKESELRRAEGKRIGLAHPNYEYGKFGDIKRADTADRQEYRTMASWLYSPITSFLCLTAAKLAAFAPKETVLQLGAGAPSNGKVAKYFESFAGKDDDAKRVVERVLDRGLKLQRDPDANILQSWKEELKQLTA